MSIASRITGRQGCFHLSCAGLFVAFGLAVVGCGGDDKKPLAPPVTRDGSFDVDAGGDAGPTDAGIDADSTSFILRGPCVAADADVHTFIPRDQIPQPAPSLVANSLNFDLTFAEQSGCADSIVIQRMASRASAPETREALDECAAARNAISVPIGSQWLVAWLDSRSGGFQVFTTLMSRAQPPQVPPVPPPPPLVRVPLTSSPDTKGSLAMVNLTNSNDALLVWSETDPSGPNGKIMGAIVQGSSGSAGSGVVTIATESGQVYGSLALAPISSGGAVLGYVVGVGETRSTFVQRLNASGMPVGTPTLLSDQGDEFATVSLAMKNDRGAAAYGVNPGGVRPGVHFVQLDAVGQPSGEPRALSGMLEHVSAVGITPSLSGFATAYRAASDVNWEFARIRVVFLSDIGNRVGDGVVDIAAGSDFGGAPSIAMALDGRTAVSWYDDDEFGNRTLKLASFPCNR